MENRIEQEINKTLQCLDGSFDIQVSPSFAEKLNGSIAEIRVARGVVYRSRAFYPVVILLMVALNFAALTMNFGGRRQVDGGSENQASVIASEYGIGQSGYTSF